MAISAMNQSTDTFIFPREPMRLVTVELADGKAYPCFLEMLQHYSSYFRACFRGGWVESKTSTVKLEDPAWGPIFPLFIEWITRLEIKPVDRDRKTTIEEQDNGKLYEQDTSPTWSDLVELWLLGDYLGVPELQNYIVGRLVKKAHRTRGFATPASPLYLVRRVWEATPASSSLRALFAEFLTNPNYFKVNRDVFTSRPDLVPADVAIDLLTRAARKRWEVFDEALQLDDLFGCDGCRNGGCNSLDRDELRAYIMEINGVIRRDLEASEFYVTDDPMNITEDKKPDDEGTGW